MDAFDEFKILEAAAIVFWGELHRVRPDGLAVESWKLSNAQALTVEIIEAARKGATGEFMKGKE